MKGGWEGEERGGDGKTEEQTAKEKERKGERVCVCVKENIVALRISGRARHERLR